MTLDHKSFRKKMDSILELLCIFFLNQNLPTIYLYNDLTYNCLIGTVSKMNTIYILTE